MSRDGARHDSLRSAEWQEKLEGNAAAAMSFPGDFLEKDQVLRLCRWALSPWRLTCGSSSVGFYRSFSPAGDCLT